MSQYQPPYDPLGYATPAFPDPNRRPTSVTAIAIIGIVYASLGLLGGLCTIPQYFGVQLTPNPVIDAVRNDPLLFYYTIGSLVLGMAFAGVLLWASIGLLKLNPAARTGIIWYAVVYLVISPLGLVLSLAYLNPRMQKITQTAMANSPGFNTPMAKQIMQFSMYGGICFSVVLLIWPVVILYFMNQPAVKTRFVKGSA